MMRHVSSRLLRRIVAQVVLAMIVIHALIPLGQPLQRVSGSPFSAETIEVSLRADHRAPVIRQVEAPQPQLQPLPDTAMIGAAAQPVATPAGSGAMPAASGPARPPLLTSAGFTPHTPRAPPAA
jgi:hypothetical protein